MKPTEPPVVEEEKSSNKNIVLIVEVCLFLGVLVLIVLNRYFHFF